MRSQQSHDKPHSDLPLSVQSEIPVAGAAVGRWTGGGQVSLLTLINLILQRRRIVLTFALGSLLITGLLLFLRETTYTSFASFMPQQSARSDASRLSGLAAQFGLNLPSGASAQPPYFYVDLLQSHEILGAAVDKRYSLSMANGRKTGTLIELVKAKGATAADRREAAIRHLRAHAVPSVQLKSGVISLSVTTRDAVLSKQVADTLLALLNQFNIQSRRAQYAAERQFAQERLQEVREDARAAEQRLRSFLEQNRQGASSPRLLFERESLERDVDLQRQLASSLIQAFEQARLEEFRDTPLIIVVEHPDQPVQPDSRHLLSRMLVGMLVGLLLGVLVAIVLDALALIRNSAAPQVVVFRQLLRSAFLRPFSSPPSSDQG